MIRPRPILWMIFILLLPLSPLFAQLNQGGTPPSFEYPNLNQPVPVMTMGTIDLERLNDEDKIREQDNLPLRFAEAFPVTYNFENAGTWNVLPNGDKLWRLNIKCQDAITINLLFDKFELPKGAQLFIYNQDHSEVKGAFTHLNNQPHKKFATGLVHGDEITLEYFLPSNVTEPGQLQVSHVNHGYRLFNTFDNARGFGDSGACQVDVNCSPEGDDWQDEKKGVAGYTIAGTFYCSGSLITNTNEDCKPYFLTADHCIDGSFDAVTNPDGSTFVFLWNFERGACSSGTPPDQTTAGCTIVANDGSSDFALFELTENPNGVYDVYFNGWDAGGLTGTGGKGIHHPAGDAKKISTHSATPVSAGNYWELYWDPTTNGHSVTEGGSSGSPLFNLSSRVIGQLYGGSALNCSDPANDLGRYGKLSHSWLNAATTDDRRKLAPWLDPVGAGLITVMDGAYSPCEVPEVRFLTKDATYGEEMANITNGCLDYFEVELIVKVRTAPTQPVTVTMNAPTGSATEGANADFTFTPNEVTLDASNISDKITVRIYNDAAMEGDESMTFSYTINANGGDAIIGAVDQTNTITISSDDVAPVNASTQKLVFLEDFSGGLGTFTTSSLASPPWEIGDYQAASSQYWGVPDNGSGNIAYTNDDRNTNACGTACNRTEDFLVSPTFDLTDPCFVSASLDFDYFFEKQTASGVIEEANVEISNNGGGLWVQLTTLPEGAWETASVDLSAYLGESGLMIRIHYNDGNVWHYGLAVDNIAVNGECNSAVQSDMNVGTTEHLGPNATVHFYDPVSGNIMATIENLDNHDYGCTSVNVTRAGTGVASAWSAAPEDFIAEKTLRITPATNNPAGNYNITLYYKEAEVDGWALTTGRSKTDLQIIKSENDLTNPQASDTRESQVASEGLLGTDATFTAQFSTGFSDFGIGPDVSVLLPVELLNFEGEFQRGGILLNWTTLSEYNNDYFSLERSPDGRDFRQIAKLQGAGTTTGTRTYEFLDQDFFQGNNYYRLKQVDTDGRFTYSNIILISVGIPADYIAVMPNPTKGKMSLQIGSSSNGPVKVNIYDVAGRKMLEKSVHLLAGSNFVDLDLNGYAKGVYILKISDGKLMRPAVRIVKE